MRSHPSGRLLRLRQCLPGLAVFALLAVGVSPADAAGLTLDQLVTANQAVASRGISSPFFSTTASNELLLAFISSDGPPASGAQTFATVTGGGLTWQLRRRANAQYGTSEIWQAVAPGPLTNARVTATRLTGTYQGSITVAGFTGADTGATGATGGASAATGAPSVALTTTRPGAWVWGAGSDWDKATPRTVGSGQTKVGEYLASAGDTFWVQRQNAVTPAAGTSVTLNDTAPTTDRWNFASVEVVPAGADTGAPTTPTALKADSVTATRVTLSWASSTDDRGVAGYRIYRDGTQVGDVSGTTFSDAGVTSGATYAYTVKAYDGAGNLSAASSPASVTTPAPDASPPSVSVSAPAAGATVSGTATVQADASDNVGVASVQFLLDGAPLGAADTSAPFSTSWNTTAATNGAHTLSARAGDAAGNATTAADVAVTVDNSGSDPAQVGQWGPLIPLPAVAIHAALTPQGKVLVFQGSFAAGGQQYVLDPSTGNVTQLADASANLFCAAQAVLADGRVQIAGGTSTTGGLGLPDNTAFNWKNDSWTNLAPMRYPRWYATATTLNDGKVLVTSGSNRNATDIVPIPELYYPATNTWKELTAATRSIPFYSFVYQLPNGKVIRLGATEEATPTETLDLDTNQWTTVDSRSLNGGSSANYAPGKFLKAGSASDGGFTGQSVSTAYTLDMNQAGRPGSPPTRWPSRGASSTSRTCPTAPSSPPAAAPTSPRRSTPTACSSRRAGTPRRGHWTKLAADGEAAPLPLRARCCCRTGGSTSAAAASTTGVTDQKTAQIYSPPYLFKGPRPTISSAPPTVQYGATTFVGTPDAVVDPPRLADPHGVGHARVRREREGDVARVHAERRRHRREDARERQPRAPRLLHALHRQRPGCAVRRLVRPLPRALRGRPGAERARPASAPPGASARRRSRGRRRPTTSASTKYSVHRSTTSGFTPSAANKVGQSTDASFTDNGLAAGTYYYRVTAEDAAGNVGPPSGEATGTVLADTTPPSRPQGLTATATTRSAALSWTAATDDVGVAGYRVFRDGTQVGTTASTSYTDSGLTPATTYILHRRRLRRGGQPQPRLRARDHHDRLQRRGRARQGRDDAPEHERLHHLVAGDQHGPVGRAARGLPRLRRALGAGTQSFSSVTGGGLTWRLRQRTNAQAGTAEIWQAAAPNPLNNVVVTATRGSGSWQGAMTVAAFRARRHRRSGRWAPRARRRGRPAPRSPRPARTAGSGAWASTGTRPSRGPRAPTRRWWTSTSAPAETPTGRSAATPRPPGRARP